MPLGFLQAEDNNVCVLTQWSVDQYDVLVDALAWLYLRKPLHSFRIMQGLEPGTIGLFGNAKQGAIDLLLYDISDIVADLESADADIRESAKKKQDARMSHRDGLLFQHISWIAARLQFPTAEATPPHVRKADKGFDGVLVDVDIANVQLSRVVLCEDKASISPRGLVTSSIWPDVKSIIAGNRDIEVLDAITPLLSSLQEEDRELAIARLVWERARHFRVALTVGDDQIQNDAYSHLFNGFDDNAGGEVTARLAEVMPMKDVRKYLDDLATQVVAKIQSMAV
ncbi:hypothetical protein GCM10011491_41950 [Brucella endophytica]|uniref:Uncharacterized protein n=1 Tax=Brucella endophytica TaxID=1963359 RepID=A0A916SR72_9HYPH|nr:hypothetical protein [Brucella endophytica]GGB09631.1 hypothetical protein GCM10011491_41950 [Brucella endophytica]